MPNRSHIVKSQTSIVSKSLKFLSLVTCHLSLVTILSGCSAIGVNKPAALQVTSTPEASIFLDGKHLGKTPFFSDQLRGGEHELKITTDDATYVSKVSLKNSTLTVINRLLAKNFLAQSGENLTLTPGKSGIFIISTPGDTTVTIDGKLVGKTPVLAQDLGEGEHKLTISKDNYTSREFSVKTTAKYQLLAEVTLASEIAKGLSAQSPSQIKIQKVEVTTSLQSALKVSQDPTLTSSEVGKVKKGDELEVIQEIEGWFKVIFEGKQGWIQARYVKKLP